MTRDCKSTVASPAPLLFCTCAILTLFLASETLAKDKPWFKYENSSFEVYSDASPKKVTTLFEDLENFRAAVIQLGGFQVPDGAAKTQVIIFNSERQFKETTTNDSVDGYATGLNGIPYIVMPAGSDSGWAYTTIRHEFVHILQAYRKTRSPPWYTEGFAEFMSALSFTKDNSEFVIGEYTGQRKAAGSLIDWNDLIGDEFKFHKYSSSAKISNAYLQSWMLVHYLTLGDDMSHRADLIRYLTLINQGKSSIEAFSTVFAEPANEMGQRIYKKYQKRIYALVAKYEPGSRDYEFIRTPVEDSAITEIIDNLKSIVGK